VLVSRKDLSRTVIEGGRYYHNCFFRRRSSAVERATTRDWLNAVADDLDEAEASVPPPRKRVRKMFHDKLAPAHRWLVAQVGRPWSKVYSELCARFDTRTVAGRHVVNDHMLAWVRHAHEPVAYSSRWDLVIDAHGILRKPPWSGRSWKQLAEDAEVWAARRYCALTYRGWWWFERQPLGGPCMTSYSCGYTPHFRIGNDWYHRVRLTPAGSLTRGQRRFLDNLPEDLRAKFVIASPWP
jgi:hypothetical protein